MRNYYEEYSNGYFFNDYLMEFGYDDEIYVCFEEFCENEYLDSEYIEQLLDSDVLIAEYKRQFE